MHDKTIADIPSNQTGRLTETVTKTKKHDHICLIYRTQDEQFAAVIPFMKKGIDLGERCVYIADENTAKQVMNAMDNNGIDVKAVIKNGSLVLAKKQDSYIKKGYFDPDWMIDFLYQATETAKKDGFPTLRVTGEMTWTLGGNPGVDRVLEYESKLNRFFPENDCLAICQYNYSKFPPEIIRDVLYTHPQVVLGGLVCKNFYYKPPDEFFNGRDAEAEVKRMVRNIYDFERNEITLKEELQRSAELEKRKDDFISMASHELKTPVTSLKAYTQALHKKAVEKGDKTYETRLAQMDKQLDNLTILIDELLDITRIQGGKIKFNDELFSLTRVVNDIVKNFSDMSGHAITVKASMKKKLFGDPERIGQVISNLIANAIKYSPKTSPVHITVTHTKTDAVVSVKDSGIGIAKKYHNKIFDRFFRVYEDDDKTFPGMGVGLFISSEIIKRHRGKIWVKSKKGQGSTFFFSLPLAKTRLLN